MEEFDFNDWLKAMAYSKADAATALGVSVSYVSKLAAHPRSGRNKPVTPAVVRRCVEASRQRVAAIEPYVSMDKWGF